MTTTCPKCQRPLRTGARFCGFCGFDLLSPAEEVAIPAAELRGKGKGKKKAKKLPKDKRTQKRSNTGRIVTILAIILLVVVIVLALVIQYWAVILPWIGQLISQLAGNR